MQTATSIANMNSTTVDPRWDSRWEGIPGPRTVRSLLGDLAWHTFTVVMAKLRPAREA